MTVSNLFLDSSIWLSYFFEDDDNAREYVEREGLIFTSVLSLYEIKRKLLKLKIDAEKIKTTIDFIRKNSILVEINRGICEEASEASFVFGLHAVDSLIYTSSMKNESTFVTRDFDFKGLKNVVVI